MRTPALAFAIAVCCLVVCGGCTGRVVRTITVESEPQGARVWLNDNEVGRTPVTAPFTWYGVYRVRVEKEGYEPVTDFQRVAAPWYQWVGPDLLFETIVPGTRYDSHRFAPYVLKPAAAADPEELLRRGEAFRAEAGQGLDLE